MRSRSAVFIDLNNTITCKLAQKIVGEELQQRQRQTRRALIMGIDTNGNNQVIKARVPLAELDKYSTTLRSLSQGRASFKQRFSDFAPVPFDMQQKLAKATAGVELVGV